MDIRELYDIYTKNGYKVTTDSRQVEPGAIFFGLRGERFDGNAFASQALENGAALAVVDNPEYHLPGKTVLVDDALKTLQELAGFHRKKLGIPIVGLTGTAGKTTTKELIKAVLAKKYKTFGTTGNLNNHIGVPLTLLQITPGYEIAVIEMGASIPGDIELLCNIADPDYGLITNIGTAHLEGFGSREVLIQTKTALYRHLKAKDGLIFVNRDDDLLMNLADHDRLHTYGTATEADTYGRSLGLNPFLSVEFRDKTGRMQRIDTRLFGEYNLYNVLAAVAVGQYFEVDDKDIAGAIAQYEPKNNRSQLSRTDKNTLILDLYNANPTSMSQALESFAKLDVPDKVLILGDMLELGEIELQEHKKILELARSLGFNRIYLVGEIFGKVNDGQYPHFRTSDELRDYLKQHPLRDSYILLKASRGIRLEKVVEAL